MGAEMIEQIKQALDNALQGKWERTGEGWFNVPNCAKIVVKDSWGQTYVANTYAGNHQEANAHLIANAPEWLRHMIEIYEECQADAIVLDKQVKEQKELIDRIQKQIMWGDAYQTAWKIRTWVEEFQKEGEQK